ncbi:MAG TPA: hypothetical protein VLG10_13410 [Methylomirabilota bacterium]|nr:hypothetical protein [Methylomirabilota bacterium]
MTGDESLRRLGEPRRVMVTLARIGMDPAGTGKELSADRVLLPEPPQPRL